ncbi:MAG: cupin-like domain-containing protein [Myxococcota bacterium]|nr:cupin-like domain-containing protein [Myxococcota bacterium]
MTEIAYKKIETVDLDGCSSQEFIERFLEPGIPCIMEGLTSSWPAHQKWTKSFFMEEMGNLPIRYHDVVGEDEVRFYQDEYEAIPLSEFISRIDAGEPIRHLGLSHPLYDFVSTEPSLKEDVDLESIRRLLPPDSFLGRDRVDASLWPLAPPFPPHMFIAGGGRISWGHFDPDNSDTFHWCVWGRKSVKLFAHENMRFMDAALHDLHHDHLCNPVDPKIWSERPGIPALKAWEGEVTAGQSLLIPRRMWHCFKNEETSMSYVVRTRSFSDLAGYMHFVDAGMSPLTTIPLHAPLWRKVEPEKRTRIGGLMARQERLLVALMTGLLMGGRFWVGLRKRFGFGGTGTARSS